MRAVLGRIEGLGGHVVDLVLPFLHPGDVVLERNVLIRGIGMGRGEAQQTGDLVLVGEVFTHAFLEDFAEFLPEAGILLLITRFVTVGETLEQTKDLFGATGADRVDVL